MPTCLELKQRINNLQGNVQPFRVPNNIAAGENLIQQSPVRDCCPICQAVECQLQSTPQEPPGRVRVVKNRAKQGGRLCRHELTAGESHHLLPARVVQIGSEET